MKSVLDKYETYGIVDFAKDMFIFDALIFNSDRHLGNFSFLVDNEKQEIVANAPLFDHNLSLLNYVMEDDIKTIDKYIKKMRPRIGEDFVEVARVILTPAMRKKLINLKGFEFKKHPKYNLPNWKLNLLNKLVSQQIELILNPKKEIKYTV